MPVSAQKISPLLVPEILSGSTDGKMIEIGATATPGTLIHTAHATERDEIWLWAVCHTSASKLLTIEWGGTSAGDLIEKDIDGQDGLLLVVPGWVLTNSLVVRAFAGQADDVSIGGYYFRS